MDVSELTIAGFQLSHLIVAFLVISTFVFVLYWLWTWPCGKQPEDPDSASSNQRNSLLPALTPLYAMEIEPGIVVLQSEDGEFFRILREYDTADKTGNGSKWPELPSSGPGNRYLLPCTRAHYQTRPSAPHYPYLDTESRDSIHRDAASTSADTPSTTWPKK